MFFKKKVKRQPRGEHKYFPYLCIVRKRNMKTVTVDGLYKALAQVRKAGMGNKKIMLSNDDEGNGYHECFFTLTADIKSFGFGSGWAAGMLPYGVTPEEAERDYVIVG